MLPQYVALVSESPSTTPAEVTTIAAALQKQVVRDFGPIWGVSATVSAYMSLDDVPSDAMPVVVRDDINVAGAAGVHEDENGQPFALVQYSPTWSLTASHETLEMLADPTGRFVVAGQSPKPGQGRVEVLVEVADPCEDPQFAYHVNGVLVSDFVTPHFEDPVAAASVRYSFTGAVTAPRQVLRGGYLSWYDPASRHWWQETFFGAQPAFRSLGAMKKRAGSVRAWIDAKTQVDALTQGLRATDEITVESKRLAAAVSESSNARAAALRDQILALTRAPVRTGPPPRP